MRHLNMHKSKIKTLVLQKYFSLMYENEIVFIELPLLK
jgi:hypothetical protein